MSLVERLTVAVLVFFGLPPDADTGTGIAAIAVLVVGAVVEALFRAWHRQTSIAAVHRAAELPAQATVPTDAKLLALLRKLGIRERDLAAVWEACGPACTGDDEKPPDPSDAP